jgi:hypothetical protein
MRKGVTLLATLTLALLAPAVGAESPTTRPPTPTCLDRGLADPASDRDNAWAGNATRLTMLEKVRRLAEEAPPLRSLLALEIGLAGSRKIYNGVWFVDTPAGVQSFSVETPDDESKAVVFSDRVVDPARYALLWDELADLRLWNTPTDSRTVGLRADIPVFYATFCRDGRLHRIRIENPPLPTWGKDDTFDQARQRHDKKAREFMLRPRDRAIEVLRLIQAF